MDSRTHHATEKGALHFVNAPIESAIALLKAKVIALSKTKMSAVLKFNQQDDSDRTMITGIHDRTFKNQSDRSFKV